MTESQKWTAARAYVDSESGKETWRVLRLVDGDPGPMGRMYGFYFDGPGFFAPKFKSWGDHYPESWIALAKEWKPRKRTC